MEEARPPAAVGAFRPLSFVVSRPRFFIVTPPVAAPAWLVGHATAPPVLKSKLGANPSCAAAQTIAHRTPLHCGISVPSMSAMGVISDRSLRRRQSRHVRFAPKADKQQTVSVCPLCAKSGCEQSQQKN